MSKSVARVLIGVSSRSGKVPDTRFLESLPPFYCAVKADQQYDIGLKWVVGHWIDAAQNILSDYALEHGYDYLLMLEDDHWGHQPEMLDALLKGSDEQHPVVSIVYHSRHYPFFLTAMTDTRTERKTTDGKWKKFYTEVNRKNKVGCHEVDFCSFGMMLIRVDALAKLSKPVFTFNDNLLTTDDDFCRKLKEELGVRPVSCFDYVLPHQDVTSSNRHILIQDQVEQRAIFKIWERKKNIQMENATGFDRLRQFLLIAKQGQADIKDQLDLLESLALSINAQTVVELGTRKGISLCALTAAMLQTGGHIWTVDVRNYDLHAWWSEEYAPIVTRVQGDDRKLTSPVDSIDFLFIDTSHHADHTAMELALWGPLVRQGGIIALHDTVMCHLGVEVPARAFAEKHNLPYLTDDKQCGMGIILMNKSLKVQEPVTVC